MELTVTDVELVRRVKAGDQDSFAELIRRHHAQVQGLCGSMLGDPAAAEDAAQEVFIKAYKSLARFEGSSAFGTWLYRIASNHCLDLLRSRARRKLESLDQLIDDDGADLRKLFSSGGSEERARENADLIARLLRCLPEDYRLILTLREVQGLSYQELTQTLGCSLDAVKARLRRARAGLEEAARHFLEPTDVSSNEGRL